MCCCLPNTLTSYQSANSMAELHPGADPKSPASERDFKLRLENTMVYLSEGDGALMGRTVPFDPDHSQIRCETS